MNYEKGQKYIVSLPDHDRPLTVVVSDVRKIGRGHSVELTYRLAGGMVRVWFAKRELDALSPELMAA